MDSKVRFDIYILKSWFFFFFFFLILHVLLDLFKFQITKTSGFVMLTERSTSEADGLSQLFFGLQACLADSNLFAHMNKGLVWKFSCCGLIGPVNIYLDEWWLKDTSWSNFTLEKQNCNEPDFFKCVFLCVWESLLCSVLSKWLCTLSL